MVKSVSGTFSIVAIVAKMKHLEKKLVLKNVKDRIIKIIFFFIRIESEKVMGVLLSKCKRNESETNPSTQNRFGLKFW